MAGSLPIPKPYQRLGAFPLDDTEIFAALNDVSTYALSPGAYPGQVVKHVKIAENLVDVYKILPDGSLVNEYAVLTQRINNEVAAINVALADNVSALNTRIDGVEALMSTDAERIAAVNQLIADYQAADASLNDTLTPAINHLSLTNNPHGVTPKQINNGRYLSTTGLLSGSFADNSIRKTIVSNGTNFPTGYGSYFTFDGETTDRVFAIGKTTGANVLYFNTWDDAGNSLGWKQFYHSGNANLSTVDWAAKKLNVNGGKGIAAIDVRGISQAIAPLTSVPNGAAWFGAQGSSAGLSIGNYGGTYAFIQVRNLVANQSAYNLVLNPLGGNVSIGTNIEIYGSNKTGVIKNTVNDGGITISGGNLTLDGANIVLGGSLGTNNLKFRIGSTEHFILTNEGYFGFGTSNPGAKVDIVAANQNAVALRLSSPANVLNAAYEIKWFNDSMDIAHRVQYSSGYHDVFEISRATRIVNFSNAIKEQGVFLSSKYAAKETTATGALKTIDGVTTLGTWTAEKIGNIVILIVRFTSSQTDYSSGYLKADELPEAFLMHPNLAPWMGDCTDNFPGAISFYNDGSHTIVFSNITITNRETVTFIYNTNYTS